MFATDALVKWGVIVLAAIALAGAGAAWWNHTSNAWIERGRGLERVAQKEANDRAHAKRQDDIAGYVVDASKRESELADRLRAAESRIDLQQQQLAQEARRNVTPRADSLCVITRGFVREHDAAVPGAAGRPALSAGGADVDEPAHVSISSVAATVRANYGQCAKCVERLAACEERRYRACVAWDERYGTKSNCARGGP